MSEMRSDKHDDTWSRGVQESLFSVVRDDLVGYRGPVVCRIVGITYRQLDYWDRIDFVKPSLRMAKGSGTQRLYSFKDVLVLKVVKELLNAGISLRNIRKAVDLLRTLGVDDLAEITLVSDGKTVYECRSQEEIIDLLSGGQGVFSIAVPYVVKALNGTITEFPCEHINDEETIPEKTFVQVGNGADIYPYDELASRRKKRAQKQ